MGITWWWEELLRLPLEKGSLQPQLVSAKRSVPSLIKRSHSRLSFVCVKCLCLMENALCVTVPGAFCSCEESSKYCFDQFYLF
jgi:hypothetical protein